MTKKKKSATPALAKPLLKLKFEKFPDKLIPVFFDAARRVFTAEFGFSNYTAPSIAALESKIKAAIKAGITPEPVWVPVIIIDDDGGTYNPIEANRLDSQFQFQVERKYIALAKSGIVEVDWKIPGKLRMARSNTFYGLNSLRGKLTALPKLPLSTSYSLILPYSAELWEKLRSTFSHWDEIVRSIRKGLKALDLTPLLQSYPQSSVSSAAGKSAARGVVNGALPAPRAASKVRGKLPVAQQVKLPAAGQQAANAGTAAAPSRAKPKPKKAKTSMQNGNADRAAIHKSIPDGPLDPALIAKLGYPAGTTISISGNNVDIKPPGHVAMLYPRKWLADRLVRIGRGEDFTAPLFNSPPKAEPREAEP